MGQLNLEVHVRSHLQEIGTLVQDKEETELGQLQEVKHVDLNNLEQVDVQEGLEQPWALKLMNPSDLKLQEVQKIMKLEAFDMIQLALLVEAVYGQLSMDNQVMPEPSCLSLEKVFFLPLRIELHFIKYIFTI